jgi:NAD(P)-dependent dehydrogenase (short-subunit alcohol dehydrogenase family)
MTVALTPRARIRAAAGTLRGSCILGSVNAGCYTEGRGAAPDRWPRRVAGPFAGRVGTPDEVPTVAAFLLGPDAAFITGADLLMDGGVIAALRAGGIHVNVA